MAPRTVSSEVIQVLIDGLINTTSSAMDARANIPISVLLRSLNSCKKLLRRGNSDLESTSWSSVMLRVVESADFDPDVTPRVLESILDLAPPYRKENALSSSLKPLDVTGSNAIIHESAASIGMLYQMLETYIRSDNINSALRIFKRLQNIIDPVRAKSMPDRIRSTRDPTTRLQYPPLIRKFSDSKGAEQEMMEETWFCPPIPKPILAAFLDFTRRTKLYHIGQWLLSGREDIDPVIPRYFYDSLPLQPALLRFATTTVNGELLYEVTRQLSTPLPPKTLRALLHCQIVLGKWDAAEDLLEYIKNEKAVAISAFDVMIVAQKLLESETSQGENEESAIRARSVLHNMLSGAYDRRPDPSQRPDYSHARLINQISRVLVSAPGGVAAVAAPFVRSEGQAHSTTNIPVHAFNVLLEGVANAYGARAGKGLWDLWCKPPRPGLAIPQEVVPQGETAHVNVQTDQIGLEKVVSPSLQTVRIILDPIVRGREKEYPSSVGGAEESSVAEGRLVRYGPKADHETLDWGVAMYRQLGMTDREIERDVPGYFS